MHIKKSYNYNIFRKIKYNRPICKKNLNKLITLNEKKDRFHLFPIVVDLGFNIIDGQHRFEACKKMEKPVYFIVDDDSENHWESITEVNQAGKKHNAGDVYEMLLKDNDKYCKMISTVVKEYPFITPGNLCHYFITNYTKDVTVLKLMQKRQHRIANFESRLNALRCFINTFGYFKLGHARVVFNLLTKFPQGAIAKYLSNLRAKGFIPISGWSSATFREELVRVHNKSRRKNRVTM